MKKYGFILLLGLGACVSQKKFDALNDRTSALIVDNQLLQDSLNLSEEENKELVARIAGATSQIEDLASDTAQLSTLYKELIKQYKDLNNISKTDAQNLSKQLQKVGELTLDLQRKDNQLKRERIVADSLEQNLKVREARVFELEKIISDREKEIQALNDKISGALLSFKNSGLTVEVKNGKVYVTLDESLLFQSGSYNLDDKGKQALGKLSGVLKQQENVTIVVEGHTDDVPFISSGTIKDNWDLSVLRATSVVRELQGAGVESAVLSASGRGPYNPKINETTKEARAKNRRTEIIISPNLDELYRMIDEN